MPPAASPIATIDLPAQTDTTGSLFELFLWGGLGVALLVILAFLWTRSRRRFLGDHRSTPIANAFSLQELRDMHTRGDLTDEEFEVLRQQLLGGYQDKTDGGGLPEGRG